MKQAQEELHRVLSTTFTSKTVEAQYRRALILREDRIERRRLLRLANGQTRVPLAR
jgi:hypothetical protein